MAAQVGRFLVRLGNDLSLPVDDGDAGPGDPGDLLDAGLDFLHGVQIDEPGVGHQFDFDLLLQLGPDLATRQKTDDPDGEHRDGQVGPEDLVEKLASH